MIKWIKRIVMLLVIVCLVISNILTLTSATFNALLSGTISTVAGIKTLSQINKETLLKQRNAVQRIGRRMIDRTRRIATRTATSATIKWVPVIGIATTAAMTIWELASLCESLKDMDQLYDEMDIDEPIQPLEICIARASP